MPTTRIYFDIEKDLEFARRGMGFLETGREIGYIIVMHWMSIAYNGWTDWHYAAFSEKTGKLLKGQISSLGGVTANGRSYKFSFEDSYGQTVYIE